MTELEGIAKTIFDEVMDEIDEEITESLEGYILEEKIVSIINDVQTQTKDQVIEAIKENYSEDMSAVKKLILGEKVARIVTADTKSRLRELTSAIIKQSFDVIDELRNEIIGEVFEETERD